jgi:molybdate transport system substrate-binding protein
LAPTAQAGETLVFAAASLTDALDEVAAAYATGGKKAPKFAYSSSSMLARQIDNGAPASLFISADEPWMDYLAKRDLVVAGTRQSFLSNRLVLVAPAKRPVRTEIEFGFPFAQILGSDKLAMADPDSVPAGRYGKAALINLGVWRDVEANVVRAENVRAALTFVERDEAHAGIVYATDAMIAKNVVIAGTFPETSHPPISYSVAIVVGHDTPAARAFYAYLLSTPAKSVYRKFGFIAK